MKRALVTGATGQVGSYLVERLVADGWSVRALVRDPHAAAWVGALGAELHPGDVLDAPRVRAAAAGCDAIFHTGALVAARAGWEQYRMVNVDGTRNVIAAAAATGARLLHVSSVAVYGAAARYRDTPTDEDAPLPPLPTRAYYARSKRDAEQAVLAAHADGRIWACAVRPDVIYGRRDRQFVPRVARIARHGIFPLIAGGGATLAIVHAASVADGAVRAVACDGAGGRAYNLANDFDVTVRQFVELASEGLGRPVRFVPVPYGAARAGFRALQLGVRLTQGAAMASQVAGSLHFLTRDNPFTSDRARRELGWTPPMPPHVGVPEAFRWWLTHRPR
ncbi:MAG: NAD-dependent epimerase/dehydratase family protein [Gemmatimonadaceae bacterium]|nr:NAD-dependent epimerase/dehydratase family protein [Gemmatimonadaceae bacterium]